MTSRSRRIALGVAVAFAVPLIAGTIAGALGSSGARQHSAIGKTTRSPQTSGRRPSSLRAGGWHPVSPATTIPPQTPVQMQYDQSFVKGLSSPTNQASLTRLEAIRLPPPGIGGGWPNVAPANTPGSWSREFVQALLDINFAHQSRSTLGPWLVAQEAPDLMPGIPPGAKYQSLYASIMDPQLMGQSALLPSASQWKADSAGRVRWSVSALQVQVDPQWQSMITAGWQPRDLRASVEDVSGLLTVTKGASTTTRRFSVALQLGSAHWHEGYGTVLVAVKGG